MRPSKTASTSFPRTARLALFGLLALVAACEMGEGAEEAEEARAAVQAVAQAAEGPHQRIQPENYRPTPSPLSPGVLVGNTLYLSGSTGGDPETGQLVTGGFEPEFRQVMSNLTRVLEAADMDLGNVVQVTTYMADMADYARYNEMYREYFTVEPLPARATVAVKELARGARVEVMMIAVR